ncbi:hypothetical protein HZC09_01930 [Candidatus Micrarchaeota archaeon]|nr:hypothetical protein [Candidatus Micrarchaeota archaeon]
MSESEFEKMEGILKEAGVTFEVMEHEAVRTSAEASKARGTKDSEGVKALVVKFKRKDKEFFVVINVPADRKMHWKKAERVLQAQEVMFATPEEVFENTGCEPGGVPPFGHLKKLPLLVDNKVFEEENSAFNAGLTTKSIKLKSRDLKKVFDSLGAAYFDLVKN